MAAVLDTHRLSKSILGPGSPAGIHHPPLQKHALADVLTELGVPYSWHHLHKAGNDATYTLHALIMLAIRWGESIDKAREGPASNLFEQLREFVEAELMKAPRWKPVERALGAHHVGRIPGDTVRGQGE